MIEVLLVIAPLFLIILLGAVLEKLKVTNAHWSPVLNEYALKIGFPALIFSALTNTNFAFSEQTDLLVVNSVLLLASFTLVHLGGKLFRLTDRMVRTLFISLGFANAAYLGIPTLLQIYGDSVLTEVSIVVAVYLFWLFTIGIGYLEYTQQKTDGKVLRKVLLSLLKNPLLLAVLFGLLFNLIGFKLPTILATSVSMIAASVTPVVLLVIGLFIGRSKFGTLKEWKPAILFSAATLLMMPALVFFGVQLFGFEPSLFSVSVLEAAMPMAITPFALTDQYHLKRGFIARSIVLSTILAVISIPFWASLVV